MKMKHLVLLFILVLMAIYLPAQNDTVYVMKSGEAIYKISINPGDLDSLIFYNPAYPRGSFTDYRDGRTYRTVTIGYQIWMGEALKYLPQVSPPQYGSDVEPYFYVYDYFGFDVEEAKATDNFKTYGVLYNWPAAMHHFEPFPYYAEQGICPDGWHVPTEQEWDDLNKFVNNNKDTYWPTVSGSKLKEAGTRHWLSPNSDATNETGFTALPGGIRTGDMFSSMGAMAIWWSSNKSYPGVAIGYSVTYDDPNLKCIYGFIPNLNMGWTVRCIMN
jgi:uncharacterized protein (TIGR02145 family)